MKEWRSSFPWVTVKNKTEEKHYRLLAAFQSIKCSSGLLGRTRHPGIMEDAGLSKEGSVSDLVRFGAQSKGMDGASRP